VIPEFKVCSRRAAEEILADFTHWSKYRYLLSIGDPGEDKPKGYGRFSGHKLRVEFDDVTRLSVDCSLASIADVEKIIDFCEGTTEGSALIHCYAGISRSAAAACILSAIHHGPGKERAALEHVYHQKYDIYPNKYVLNLADQLLERRGNLLKAAFSIWPQSVQDVELVDIPTVPARRLKYVR
jgi:predicted protein tyrosine phosphatase